VIRREAQDGFLLITQHDHALLSGELAERLGCVIARPTIEAIANHDCGWPVHDDCPTLNNQGLPLHVFETPVPISTRVWNESVTRARGLGDYQGLLVSLHVLNLSAMAMSHGREMSRGDLFEMNKFQHRQIEVQEELRARLGLSNELPRQLGLAKAGASAADDRLLSDFLVLTMLDRISLSLCCGNNLFPTLQQVAAGAMRLVMPDSATMEIEPWPFEEAILKLEVPARSVGKGPFGSVDEFRGMYANAPAERLAVIVRRSR
jgi:hypothetical protein